jgi:hypothetical protein
MEPQPVRQNKTPGYPTRREMLAGAAGFALAGLCGRMCVFAATEEGKTIVAPLFEHGEGRGATGCVVVSPPVFLSEEEAMQIIREELAKKGIRLKASEPLTNVRIPQRFKKQDVVDKGNGHESVKETVVEDERKGKPLTLNGIDSEKKVGVELVSKENYFKLGGVQESYYDESSGMITSSSVQRYDFKEAAKYVGAQVNRQGTTPLYLGLFYDPQWELRSTTKDKDAVKRLIKAMRETDGKWREQRKAEMKDLLRQQARDFAAWLKEKKVVQ